ncbi:hypothetical protein IE81DRAFT_324618 [Ceraceosorus guamensis]|uniref:Uncharacterized protein n=1 Tax=Ceraceosorus guamensis TaxID=1522189 RepID=A0A316VUQ2_9BASI|nr:hypothetical protein IE81DRAFT_324618 [Ceraceosorus guamensis]PWN41346.1 hypothetical protein IE81DRAFT_324618 [Ceraceosorus guamensis]
MHASSYLVAAVGFAAYAYAQGTNGFTVATPSGLVQCQPVRLTWMGGVPPYFPRISQPGQVGQIIEQFPQTTDTFYVWTVNQPVGQTVTIAVGDSNGEVVGSAITPAIVAGSSSW